MTTINNYNKNYICIALCILSRSQSAHNTMLYLFISGDMMKPSGWLLSIEGHVVMGPHLFFLHGVAAFFSSYYVFNLEYPAAGSSTLEFIQRYFIKITFNLVIRIIVQASNSMIVLRFKMLTNEVPEVSLVRPF